MEEVLEIVDMGRAARNAANIKNRQPIGNKFVKAEKALNTMYQEIIADELNVKKVTFTDDVRDFTSYTFKPQLKTVGPKYGKFLGGIKQYLAQVDGYKAMYDLNANGCITFDVNGENVVLSMEDLLIDMAQKEGYVSQADKNLTVVLDTNLTEELIEEGFVREVISKIQTMRKEAGFEVTDKIVVYIDGNEKVSKIVQANAKNMMSDVMAVDMKTGVMAGYSKQWNINGENVTIGVER